MVKKGRTIYYVRGKKTRKKTNYKRNHFDGGEGRTTLPESKLTVPLGPWGGQDKERWRTMARGDVEGVFETQGGMKGGASDFKECETDGYDRS